MCRLYGICIWIRPSLWAKRRKLHPLRRPTDNPHPAAPLEAVRQADYTPQPIAYTPEQMPAAPERSGYYEAADDDTQMLSLVNDRLRAQARRYPHPITNEMEAIH